MMVVYFVGMGLATVATGFVDGPFGMVLGLAAIGLFGAIYHPVGMAWLVRNATDRGRALGWNGMFGSIGVALGPLMAGALSQFVSWRAAFIVPGVLTVAIGIALLVAWRRGRVGDVPYAPRPNAAAPSRGDIVRAFVILSVTMVCVGIIGNIFSVMLPKLFAERFGGLVGSGAFGAGALVTLVYLFAAGAQPLGGWLADRFSMRRIYLVASLIQAPVLLVAAWLDSWPLLLVSVVMVFVNISALPAENGLVAHYSPGAWQGTAYGAKFVLAIGAAGAAIPAVGWVHDATGGFAWLFVAMSALAAIVCLGALLLPEQDRAPLGARAGAAAPAE
jgi:MFS family permease